MFGLFRKRTPLEEMKKRHARLEQEAYELSRTDRKAADAKTAEAEALWKEIEALRQRT